MTNDEWAAQAVREMLRRVLTHAADDLLRLARALS